MLTGNFVYFDNAKEQIEPEHIMASGALPPGLPMIKIGTDHFWDGGSLLRHFRQRFCQQHFQIMAIDVGRVAGARRIHDVLVPRQDVLNVARQQIVSNTPLQHLLDQEDKLNTLVFQVDLFSARGAMTKFVA